MSDHQHTHGANGACCGHHHHACSPTINPTAIGAVMRRQLASLLGNPLGYVFILAFVLASGAGIFLYDADRFFARNIADLAPLYAAMPFFLVVLLPALGMGAWAAERDQGTEEHLLTLPLSIIDALLGKYLAVTTYFTIALACSLCNVAVLMWLGSPDLGLVAANYFGWWLAGLAFAAFALLASVLVSMPAVAFVIGTVFSGILLWAAREADWFDAFNRGVVQLGAVGAALAVVVAGIGAAAFVLASRRWRPGSAGTVAAQVASLALGLVLVANLARLAHRGGVDADATSEGLSSISAASARLLDGVQQQVAVNAFISTELPPDLELKAKEVESKLKAIARSARNVKVEIHRPADALDKSAELATKEFSLKPRKVIADDAAGRDFKEVFLGAAVTCGGRTQVIEHFDPGLSVEYELVRAVRAVAAVKKRVLGVASTDLDMNGGGFDYATGQMGQGWEIVEEWKKQYEVRPVSLDSEVPAEIELLVVPQPSTLTQAQIERLHDHIWAGRPTMIMEDPMPYFPVSQGRNDLVPGQPKKSAQQQNPYGPPPEGGPQKGDVKPLWRALGLDFDEAAVLWSTYNPSHQFRGLIPPEFVWTSRNLRSIAADKSTTGLDSMLFPFPGALRTASDRPASLTVTPLVSAVPPPTSTWGLSRDLLQRDFMGRSTIREITRRTPTAGDAPAIVVQVTGTMPSAFPKEDPAAKAEEGKPKERKTGLPSAKPINVVVIADIDFANNEFFNFYRNPGNRFNQDEVRFLTELRNVQLAANMVDSLMGDAEFVDLRTRRAERRPLARLEEKLQKTTSQVQKTIDDAQDTAQSAIDKANANLQEALRKIDARDDLDDNAKAHERLKVQMREQRKVDLEIQRINSEKDQKIRDAKIDRRRAVVSERSTVQTLAIAVPSAVLLALILLVLGRKLASERSHVPAGRKRAA